MRDPAMSGADHLKAIRDGVLSAIPIFATMAVEIGEVLPGQVTLTCTPGEWAANPMGAIHGGVICTLLDAACAGAVHASLPADKSYTSVELKVNYLRAASPGGALTAIGRTVKHGSRISFSEGSLLDSFGALIATATSTCLILQREGQTPAIPVPVV